MAAAPIQIFPSPRDAEEQKQLDKLHQLVQDQTTYTIPTDEWYLLGFLRYAKGDVGGAFDKLLSKWKERVKLAWFYDDVIPSEWKELLETDFIIPFAKREKGMQILYVRMEVWDPAKFSLFDISKVVYFSGTAVSRRQETQVNGVIYIIDLSGFTMGHVKRCTPSALKLAVDLFQGFPLQIKGLHYVNEPPVFNLIWGFIRMFMKKKLRERMQLHGTDFEGSLHKVFDPAILPEQYGGLLKLEDALEKGYSQSVLDNDQYYKDFFDKSKYGLKEERSLWHKHIKVDLGKLITCACVETHGLSEYATFIFL